MIIYKFNTSNLQFTEVAQSTVNPVDGSPMFPANSTLIKPTPQDGEIAIWNVINAEWEYTTNDLGQTAYSKDNSHHVIIDSLDFDHTNYTYEKPETKFDKWNGSEWVLDMQLFKDDIISKISAFADEARHSIVSGSSEIKMIGWLKKQVIASSVIAGTATDEETLSIKKETELRGLGESVSDLAQKQIKKADDLSIAVALIDGLEFKASNYVSSTSDTRTEIIRQIDIQKDLATIELQKIL